MSQNGNRKFCTVTVATIANQIENNVLFFIFCLDDNSIFIGWCHQKSDRYKWLTGTLTDNLQFQSMTIAKIMNQFKTHFHLNIFNDNFNKLHWLVSAVWQQIKCRTDLLDGGVTDIHLYTASTLEASVIGPIIIILVTVIYGLLRIYLIQNTVLFAKNNFKSISRLSNVISVAAKKNYLKNFKLFWAGKRSQPRFLL